jgi:hypothetical protein
MLGPINIRGVEVELWRWLKAQAPLEGKAIGQKLNEIVAQAKHISESHQQRRLLPMNL